MRSHRAQQIGSTVKWQLLNEGTAMTLRELVPLLQKLNRSEKIYAIQLLAAELAKEENDIVQQNISIIDQSDTWTEQDQIDLTTFSLQYAVSTSQV